MKEIWHVFVKILAASLLCMVAYLALYFIWGALLKEVSNETVRLILLSACTSAAYAAILFWLVRFRHGVGREEVLADYKTTEYTTIRDDLRTVLTREKPYLIMITAVIMACFVINKGNRLLFDRINTPITFPFATMCIFSSCFPAQLDVIGYLLSSICIMVFYVLFVALYRKKQYDIWLRKEEDR